MTLKGNAAGVTEPSAAVWLAEEKPHRYWTEWGFPVYLRQHWRGCSHPTKRFELDKPRVPKDYMDKKKPAEAAKGTEMQFSIETEREEDGRWIAEIADIPGV